jgi:hypothetical protein
MTDRPPHTVTRGPSVPCGRAVTVAVPRPQNPDGTLPNRLTVVVPNVARLTDARRVSIMREALRLAGWAELADTATEAQLIGESHRRMGVAEDYSYALGTVDGRPDVSYTWRLGGGGAWADDWRILP